MANAFGFYDVPLYAATAALSLRKALGMASRVYLGYDEENQVHKKGSVINIKRPTTFTAQNEPSTVQDLNPDQIQLTASNWKGVRFSLTDKSVAQTERSIIEDHIPNAAYAVADAVDQSLDALYKDIPWVYNTAGTTIAVADIAAAKRIMTNNQVPMKNEALLHFMVGAEEEEALSQLAAFSQWQGAGQAGVDTQLTGQLGRRYGFGFYTNQNRPSHTPGTLSDLSVQLFGAVLAGATTLVLDNTATLTGTLVAGDSFVIAGNTQRYAVTATGTASADTITVLFTPPLVQNYADNALVTVDAEATKVKQAIAHHRDAFALAFANLPDYQGPEFGAANMGINAYTVIDDVTGLSIRARMWYEGTASTLFFGVDACWGVKTLNPNLAVRVRQA